ncbi:hypothetical protein [Streptomyces sp. NPDC127098]|uniref:hypothetical protein n=1 Tax=Streptomyces sp. NPDC127098 TaxID=3347137 RepID=UPI00364C8B6B
MTTSLSSSPTPATPGALADPGGTPARRAPRTFLGTGIVAVGSTAVAVPLGLLDRLPLPDGLGEGGTGGLGAVVLGAALWAVLFALARLASTARERFLLGQVRLVLADQPYAVSVGSVRRSLTARLNGLPLENSFIGRRLRALTEAGESVPGVLAAHSELDHGHREVTYGPARALTWALPALGFLGTASEMARAVEGLGSTVAATSDYAQLRDALVTGVIPALAHAFTLTLFALGASVVAHTLLAWAHAREERVLLDVEDVMLEIGTLVGPGRGPGGAAAVPAELPGQLAGLAHEVGEARRAMTESVGRLSALDLARLGPLLQSVDHRLELIHGELGRDLVISRAYRPGPPRS